MRSPTKSQTSSTIMNQIDTTLAPLTSDARIRTISQAVMGARIPFASPIGRTRSVIYCDYFASGRPLKFIEDTIRDHVLPFYANTHTTTTVTARYTMAQREQARDVIRRCLNADKNLYSVIFTGSGSTAAIVHLATTLRLYDHSVWLKGVPKPTIFVSVSEHRSNLLPWRESVANVVMIPLDATGRQLDLIELERQVVVAKEARSPLLIGSFSAGSNLTGIVLDADPIARVMHRHGGLAFFDYAGVGAYVEIDMNPADDESVPVADCGLAYKDAVFLSPHKFIGGPGTPGVLVARSSLFRPDAPTRPGGGSVNFVTRSGHEYLNNLEEREEAGTPAIVEAIRCGLVFRVKELVGVAEIKRREHAIATDALEQLAMHPRIHVLGDTKGARVPVFCIQIAAPDVEATANRFLHYNFVSAVLNDFFGIQTRGGCMCAGPYGTSLLNLTNDQIETLHTLVNQDPSVRRRLVSAPAQPCASGPCSLSSPDVAKFESMRPGYLRFSFNYFTPTTEVDAVLRAVTWIADHGWRLLPYYRVDSQSGSWSLRCTPAAMLELSRKNYRSVPETLLQAVPTHAFTSPVASVPAESDSKALRIAQRFADRVGAIVRVHGAAIRADLRDGFQMYGAAVESVRQFMHPAEAVDMLADTVVTVGTRKPTMLMQRVAGRLRATVSRRGSFGLTSLVSTRPVQEQLEEGEDSGVDVSPVSSRDASLVNGKHHRTDGSASHAVTVVGIAA
ncbi:hypothetical protein AMAG_12201 [Allomyces macrogynus ATCC 38327]|uniref:Aminotransferase class V domain-containing protein n=1 Tax=Allomyces macrogynus (strain ATCC 38327) TaxID=578462 RepID=A0A0L0SX44_ALLM3|nr:hypothetical protein AMAG_12201 [Allomyces macrogynus ATCC 38327]|eukprot:KNE67128.1 hypothetical protein AMAG_12201 [Allomyces macrogynus ATCC 38327]